MESTIILGWLFLLTCANSDNHIELAQRIKYEPQMQQLVEYLIRHKEEITQGILAHIEGEAAKKIVASDVDVEWYLDNISS